MKHLFYLFIILLAFLMILILRLGQTDPPAPTERESEILRAREVPEVPGDPIVKTEWIQRSEVGK